MLCGLCQSRETVKHSHVIPKFVGKWVKETSPLGGLRNVAKPNVRQQDTTTAPLLCPTCEEYLSSKETKFAQELFYPFSDSGQHDFAYSDWLQCFAVSMSWRVGASLLRSHRIQNVWAASQVERALLDWRNFLFEKQAQPGQYAHHLFFDSLYPCRLSVGPHYDGRYVDRTIDYAIPFGDKRVAIYIKLPGMVFFSGVHPPNPEGWRNTRILNNGRILASEQEVADSFFWQCMKDSAANVTKSMSTMSSRQRRKLQERMETAPPRYQIRRERSEKTDV